MINQIVLKHYQIIEKIGEGGTSIVYRGISLKSNQTVAIKILRSTGISHRLEDIIRFQTEARLISRLRHPNIIEVHDVGEFNDNQMVVMEYVEGSSLGHNLASGKPLPVDLGLEIAQKIASALNHVHQKGIVHRDVAPDNVLIAINQDRSVGFLKLIDFGLSQVRELTNLGSANCMVGTFYYMSPELTGLLKRSVDERSDLYSLGIILYQMLTGTLPFQGCSVGTVIHQQIAKTPVAPTSINRNIPEVLEKVVLKLLEKGPENRYQSAKGLLVDLEKISHGNCDFLPGLSDSNAKIDFNSRLIGREKELQLLVRSCRKTANQHRVFCFIMGEPGIGKTRLVESFREHLKVQQKAVIEGQCFKGSENQPYGLVRDIISSYLREYDRYSEERKSKTRKQISDIVGDLGGIITALNHQAEDILGESPSLVRIEPEMENQRFLMVTSRFFRGIAAIEGGLVLILDDLQWADQRSLELLHEIMTDLKTEPLFIIGLYREGEVPPDHYLQKIIQGVFARPNLVRKIRLENFTRQQTDDMIQGLLHEKGDSIRVLSDFVFRKSRGNPFFIIEVLKQLVAENAIVFQDCCRVHEEKLDTIEIHSSIVDMLLKKIARLSKESISVLSYAAVIGRTFEIALLFELTKELYSRKRMVEIVDEAIKFQLLEYHPQKQGKLIFAHDRIKEAFYLNLCEEEKKKLHLDVARELEILFKQGVKHVLFDLADHYLQGEDKEKTIEFAWPAGLESARRYANDEALFYLLNARAALLETRHDKSLSLESLDEEIVKIYLVTGQYDKAIELLNKILPLKKTPFDKALVYKKINEAYYKKGNWNQSEHFGNIGLKLLGETNHVSYPAVLASIIKEFTIHLFHHCLPRLSFSRKSHQEEASVLINHYYHSLGWVYGLDDTLKFIRIMLRMLNQSRKCIPLSKEHAASLMGYGTLCMVIPLFKRALIYHQKALALYRSINYLPGIGESLQFIGLYYQWAGDYPKSIEFTNQSLEVFEKIGDIKGIEISTGNLAANYLYLSDYKKALECCDTYKIFAEKLNDTFGTAATLDTFAEIYKEKGQLTKARQLQEESHDFARDNNIGLIHCTTHISKGKTALEEGNIDEALDSLNKAKDLYENGNYFDQYTAQIYALLAKAACEHFKRNRASLSSLGKRRALGKIKKMCKKALKKTHNWRTYHCNSLLSYAHYLSLTRHQQKAERFFRKCINFTKNYSRRFETAIALLEFGQFLMVQNRENEARSSWKEAYALFREIESTRYSEKLQEMLGITESALEGPMQRYIKALKNDEISAALLELHQHLASNLKLDDLLNNILSLALNVSKAQSIFLFVKDVQGCHLKLHTKKTIDPGFSLSDIYSRSIVQTVFESGDPVITSDAVTDDSLVKFQSVFKQQAKSIMCFPIHYKQEIKGVCYLDNMLSNQLFSGESMDIMNALMTQSVILIENERLQKKAPTAYLDPTYFQEQCATFAISKREQEVLKGLIDRLTNKNIAKNMFITVSTVKKHLYSIYNKTNAADREHLVNLFTLGK